MSESIDDRPNIRSREYFLAQTTVHCHACGLPSQVLALALPAGHELRVPADSAREEDLPGPEWERSSTAAFLFFVRAVTPAVRLRCLAMAANFRMAAGGAVDRYWSNHCERCGERMDDHELHGEPDAGFIPTSAQRAQSVRLSRIGEPLEAIADGYALDPQFFDQMPEA